MDDFKNVESVIKWLEQNSLGNLSISFRDNEIDGEALIGLFPDEMQQLVPKLRPRSKLNSLLR